MIAWSDRRHPNSRSIASLHRNSGSQDGKKNPASLKFVKSNSLVNMYKMSFGTRSTNTRQTIWRTTLNLRYLIENWSRAVLCDWVEFISVFSNSCWSTWFQALCDRLCLYQERSSKLKVRRTLLTNHHKIITWGHLRIAHRETHTVNNRWHSFPVH